MDINWHPDNEWGTTIAGMITGYIISYGFITDTNTITMIARFAFAVLGGILLWTIAFIDQNFIRK